MKLPSDFTTLEQSKKLLELGVPKNSANLYYNKFGALEAIPEYRNFSEFCDSTDTPCWSVGRLINIYEICFGGYFNSRYFGHTLMEDVLLKIEEQIDSIDFSKLKE